MRNDILNPHSNYCLFSTTATIKNWWGICARELLKKYSSKVAPCHVMMCAMHLSNQSTGISTTDRPRLEFPHHPTVQRKQKAKISHRLWSDERGEKTALRIVFDLTFLDAFSFVAFTTVASILHNNIHANELYITPDQVVHIKKQKQTPWLISVHLQRSFANLRSP